MFDVKQFLVTYEISPYFFMKLTFSHSFTWWIGESSVKTNQLENIPSKYNVWIFVFRALICLKICSFFNEKDNKQWYHCIGWQMKGFKGITISIVFLPKTTWWSFFISASKNFKKMCNYKMQDYRLQCQKSTIEGKAWLPFPKIFIKKFCTLI